MSPNQDLLERGEQLAVLNDCWSNVRATRRGRVVLISGEAGVGKTSLVTKFCDQAMGGPRVLRGACDPWFTPRPFGPFLDIAHAAAPARTRALAEVVPGGRPDEVAAALLADSSALGPGLVVLEDFHWADEVTLDVLRLVVRRIESQETLVLVTYRDDELHRSHPLQIVLGDIGGGLARVRVSPLSRSAVVGLAAAENLDGAELYHKTGGNPFFVTEVLATGRDPAGSGIPDTVREAVLARVGRLDEPAQTVVEAIAIAAPNTELWLLEALAPGASQHLARCLASGVVTATAGGVAFRHELARLAVQESLDPGRSVQLHRAAVDALSKPRVASPDLARLAHHAEAAGDASTVLQFAPLAGAEAAHVGSHREAAAQYARAVRAAAGGDPEIEAELQAKYSWESYLADYCTESAAAAVRVVDLYRAMGDPLRQASALLNLSTVQRLTGEGGAAEAAVREALELLADLAPGRGLAVAYAATAGIAMCNGRGPETFAAGSEALRIAEELGDTDTLVRVLTTIGTMEMEDVATRQSGDEKLVRSIQLAKAAGLHDHVGRAYNNLTHESLSSHDLERAERSVGEWVPYFIDRGIEFWLNCALGARADVEFLKGDWDAAVQTAWTVLEAGHEGVTRLGPLSVLGLARARRGDPDAWGPLDDALTMARRSGELQCLAPITAVRSEVLWLEGSAPNIADETQDCVDRALRGGDRWALSEVAYWRWKAGITESIAPDSGSPRLLQMAGRSTLAAATWANLGYRYEAALALSESDDEADLRSALEQFRHLGATTAAAIVAHRLRERGARGVPRGPRATTASNPALLTRREMDVLRLVSDGLRDAEIAQRLFLSEKTVGHHVSAVLRKLGVSTRGHAAAAARERSLLGPS